MVRVTTVNKVFRLEFRHAVETMMMGEGIAAARRTQKELNRSAYKTLKYNVEVFYYFMAANKPRGIATAMEGICRPISGELTLEGYMQGFRKVAPELGFLADAFYSRKPFAPRVFRTALAGFHGQVRGGFERQWNGEFARVGAGEALAMAETMSQYTELLKKWAIKDAFLTDWEKPILQTFLYFFFENAKPLLCNLVGDLGQGGYLQAGKLQSRAIDNLESHLNLALEHYRKTPLLSFARELCFYAGAVLGNFLVNLIRMVKRPDLGLEVFIMLLNSNFVKVIKGVEKKLTDLTKNGLPLPAVKNLLNDDFLFYAMRRLYNVGLERFKARVRALARSRVAQKGFLLDLKFRDKVKEVIKEFSTEGAKLVSADLASETVEAALLGLVEGYIELYLAHPQKVTPANVKELITKVEHNFKSFEDKVTAEHLAHGAEPIRLFQHFRDFVASQDLDVLTLSLLNLQVYFPRLAEDGPLRSALSTKLFLPRDSTDFIVNHFVSPKLGKTVSLSKRQQKQLLKKWFNTAILVIVFLLKMRWVIRLGSPPETEAAGPAAAPAGPG